MTATRPSSGVVAAGEVSVVVAGVSVVVTGVSVWVVGVSVVVAGVSGMGRGWGEIIAIKKTCSTCCLSCNLLSFNCALL